MLYITGQQALNLPCLLDTCGDWHTSALKWNSLYLKDSSISIFQDYGIETNKIVPNHSNKYNVANHIRAILDLLDEHNFGLISNFKKDFICNDMYTEEIFQKVITLLPDKQIEDFIHKVYGREWRLWIGNQNMKKF